MRFITEMCKQKGFWVVVDTADKNAIVGVHKSATLATLDAFKLEQDNWPKRPLAENTS